MIRKLLAWLGYYKVQSNVTSMGYWYGEQNGGETKITYEYNVDIFLLPEDLKLLKRRLPKKDGIRYV